jgi:transcriptional regulator with XRE-family HTH domain
MPDPHRLYVLTHLRKRAKISLATMARACGLTGSRAYESASAWESGKSIPHRQLRSRFLIYLAHTLGLSADDAQLETTWNVLVDAWGWDPLREDDWQFIRRETVLRAYGGEGDADSLPPVPLHTRPVERPGHLAEHAALPLPAPLPPGSRIPYTPNPLFVGRAGELRALAEILLGRSPHAFSPAPLAAVVGASGIGKTQLAVEFAHRFGHSFAGGVF